MRYSILLLLVMLTGCLAEGGQHAISKRVDLSELPPGATDVGIAPDNWTRFRLEDKCYLYSRVGTVGSHIYDRLMIEVKCKVAP